MPYHIPFEHRRRGAPIYIGFETIPPRPRRRWNGWGLASFAVLGLSVGVLAPVAFLLGLIGMRRSPRTLATFSTLVSGSITALMALGVAAAVHHSHERHARYEAARAARFNAQKTEETRGILQQAEGDIDDYCLANEGQMPSQYDGMLLAVQHADAWNNALRYDIDQGKCLIRSAGPAQRFETRDDVTLDVGVAPAEAF
jgi:hypothetical protein